MSEKEIFLHLGLPKTGSTFIQKNLLADNFKDTKVILKSPNNLDNNIADKLLLYLNHSNEQIRNEIKNLIDDIPQKKIIISNEGLFGHQGNGYSTVKKRFYLLENLFDKPKYIIFFREASEIILSWYNFSLKKGIYSNFNDYISNDIDKIKNIIPKNNYIGTNYKIYDYNKLFEEYLKISSRVLFLDYKDFFSKDSNRDFNKLSLFLNINFNKNFEKKYNESDKNIIYFYIYKNFKIFKLIKYLLNLRISRFILSHIKLKKFELVSNEGELKDWMILSKFVSIYNLFFQAKNKKNLDLNLNKDIQIIKNYHSENFKNFKKKILNN